MAMICVIYNSERWLVGSITNHADRLIYHEKDDSASADHWSQTTKLNRVEPSTGIKFCAFQEVYNCDICDYLMSLDSTSVINQNSHSYTPRNCIIQA